MHQADFSQTPMSPSVLSSGGKGLGHSESGPWCEQLRAGGWSGRGMRMAHMSSALKQSPPSLTGLLFTAATLPAGVGLGCKQAGRSTRAACGFHPGHVPRQY